MTAPVPAPPIGPPAAPTHRPPASFWRRNLFWLVPVGCLGMIVMFVGFIASIAALAFAAMRSSEPARVAIAAVEASPRVQAQLGSPVEAGWWLSGSVNVTGPGGTASLMIPLSGSKRAGTLYVEAYKRAGRWDYEVLEVEIEGQPVRLDLRAGSREPLPGAELR